jgi:hypothetical protein
VKDDPELLAPSVRHTRPRSWDYADSDHRLIERQVTVTNPDGSTTEVTYWSDTHID